MDSIRNEKGIALLLTLFIMAFLSLIATAFFDVLTIEQQIATNQIREMQAVFIADAGVETAVYELRQNSNWSGTGGDVEFPSGSGNTYNVSASGGTITSTGTVSNFSSTIEAGFSSSGSSAPYTVLIDTWKEV